MNLREGAAWSQQRVCAHLSEELGNQDPQFTDSGLGEQGLRFRCSAWGSLPWDWAVPYGLTDSLSCTSPTGDLLASLGCLHHPPAPLSLLTLQPPLPSKSLALLTTSSSSWGPGGWGQAHLVELPALPAPAEQCLHVAAHQEGGEDQ